MGCHSLLPRKCPPSTRLRDDDVALSPCITNLSSTCLLHLTLPVTFIRVVLIWFGKRLRLFLMLATISNRKGITHAIAVAPLPEQIWTGPRDARIYFVIPLMRNGPLRSRIVTICSQAKIFDQGKILAKIHVNWTSAQKFRDFFNQQRLALWWTSSSLAKQPAAWQAVFSFVKEHYL